MQLHTQIEVKQFLLEMAKRCREDMELPLNVYLENVSKNIDEITYVHPLEDDIPPTSQYFPKMFTKQDLEDSFDEGVQYRADLSSWSNACAKSFDVWFSETYGSKGSDEHHEDKLDEIPTSSQTEISDEEIEEYAKRNAFQYYEFITGAKWYREQLKKKI